MRNIALTLMYDGTAYHGWQMQKRDVTVAETLEKALAHVVGHPVKCTGAGRTDAGVHAERYVANFRTDFLHSLRPDSSGGQYPPARRYRGHQGNPSAGGLQCHRQLPAERIYLPDL